MQTSSRPAPEQPFLAADVGGTHARIGLVVGRADGRRPVSMLHYHRYGCADWSGLDAMLEDFLDQLAATPYAAVRARIRHCSVASAGYVLDERIVNQNLPWPVSIPEVNAKLGLERLVVINDFQALAYAAQFVTAGEIHPVIEAAAAAPDGPVLVMGPGTGLGSAVLLPDCGRARVLSTEAGQISFAPVTEREIEVLRMLGRGHSHVSFEDVLSGPGLLKVYRALCALDAGDALQLTPAEVTAAALGGHDAAAIEALEMFCAVLGGFAGDLALLYGARGGVHLAGGILPQIHAFLRRSAFAERFRDKGVMRAYLEKIPVDLIEHGQLGVIGAASWFLDGRADT